MAIASDLLDRTGRAILAGDFDSMAECFAFPLISESFAGQQTVESREAFRPYFSDMCRFYTVNNVTDLVRRVVSAEFESETVLQMVHESRFLTDQGALLDIQSTGLSRVRLVEGAWKIDLTRYANYGMSGADSILAGTYSLDKDTNT